MVNESELIGLTEAEATLKIRADGYRVRIEERDGEAYVLTMGLHTGRWNLIIEDGIVVGARLG